MRPIVRHLHGISLALFALWLPAHPATSRELTFEDRVEAQRAIERVYFSHMEGTRRTFEQAVTRDVLERKVRAALLQSAALERQWRTPITAAMLAAEADRIARSSQFPERLAEIEAALGHDAFLVQETLVRSALAERLTRNFFAYDPGIHAAARAEADAIQQQLAAGTLDPAAPHPRRSLEDVVQGVTPASDGPASPRTPRMQQVEGEPGGEPPAPVSVAGTAPLPRPEALGIVIEESGVFWIRVQVPSPDGSARVAVYSVPKISWEAWWEPRRAELADVAVPAVAASWSGFAASRRAAGADCPPDGWDNGLLDDVPEPRYGHTAVWTGTEMIVYGGSRFSGPAHVGGRYDPLTDTWRGISRIGAPGVSGHEVGVWTGSELIVWGGGRFAGRYDPVTDTWGLMSGSGMPEYQARHAAVWTGREMIVWGGSFRTSMGDGIWSQGARYDPVADSWRVVSPDQAPSARVGHTAVWTGQEMIVWGGETGTSGDSTTLATGGRYDPLTDAWSPTSATDAPSSRMDHTAVWTGVEMIVWGGLYDSFYPPYVLGDGSRYDPVTDTWTPVSTSGAPQRRHAHAAVWTGEHMFIINGLSSLSFVGLLSGGRYDPSTDSWVSIPAPSSPATRFGTAVWTGNEVVFWGGGWAWSSFLTVPFWAAGRLDPEVGQWMPLSRAASGGVHVEAGGSLVWTGTEMIVWSAGQAGAIPDAPGGGGRYDPVLDTWRSITTSDAPVARTGHAAVWTGDEMMIYGGGTGTPLSISTPLLSGGRYDPIADSWRPVSQHFDAGARIRARAVWTGGEVILRGGLVGPGHQTVRYDPAEDTWSPLPSWGASPDAEILWTGMELLVLGYPFARYRPDTAEWIEISTPPGGASWEEPAAVWTGRQMIAAVSTDYSRLSILIYDVASDTWSSRTFDDARFTPGMTGVWTGRHLLIWGGNGGAGSYEPGFSYDPATGSLVVLPGSGNPFDLRGAPSSRIGHSAVWTGKSMLVWGGFDHFFETVASGGRYFFGQGRDDDGDGLSECQGDCHDADPSVYPGAPEACNARDDSCEGLIDEDDVGLDTDEDGTRNACDACPDFFNPGQGGSFVCATAGQDGGVCLETTVQLAAAPETGEVTIVRELSSPPHAIHFELPSTSCGRIDPVDISLNGTLLARFLDAEATCQCGESVHKVTITDAALIAGLWRPGGPNRIAVRLPGASWNEGTKVGWVRARLTSPLADAAAEVCLFDAFGGACTVKNPCEGGWNMEPLEIGGDVPLLTSEDVLRGEEFDGTNLPGTLDLAGIPDGPMKFCVGSGGSPKLYASGRGELYQLDLGSGDATERMTFSWLPSRLAHDDTRRTTWAQVNRQDGPDLVALSLITGAIEEVSPFLARGSSGLEAVNGRLYSIESTSEDPRLLEVNPESGYSSVAAELPAGSWAGLAFDAASDSFLSAGLIGGMAALHRLDATTGAVEPLHDLPFMPTDVEFGPDGALYAARDLGSDTELYRLDPATGDTVLVGSMGAGGITTLATVRKMPRGCLDLVKQGEQTLAINGSCSSPPTAFAGADITAECSSFHGALVRLDGSGSTDPDGDITRYDWLTQAGSPGETVVASGAAVDVMLPLGFHDLTLRVSDGAGATSDDAVRVAVVDTQAPTLHLTPYPAILWPPNHRVVPVDVSAVANDACDPFTDVSLVSVTSSEPDDAPGVDDGHTTDDLSEPGGDLPVMLRAERSGSGPGRIYTLTYLGVDASGNAATGSTGVLVPHDQGGITEPIDVTVRPDAIEWTPVAGAVSYNVLRAPLSGLASVGSFTLVHDAVCAGREVQATRLSGGPIDDTPPPGEIFGYLVESFDGRPSGYGTAQGMREIVIATGDACQ